MSCNICNTKFNFFHKELGCSNCGLSFCSKCLKKGLNVCKLCYSKSSSVHSSDQSSVPPPDKFIKRLRNLQNPIAPPITIYRQNVDSDSFKSGLSAADRELVERLERIKKDGKKPIPTESEIRLRLAKLKGQNEYVETSNKPSLITVDRRTEQEKIDSLLEQFTTEKDIELAHNPANEIESRLAALREQGIRPNEGSYISNLRDSSGSEEEIDKITRKVMAEVALEELLPPEEPADGATTSELPWCVLCNADASRRCLDCDGDLYCAACDREVHRDAGDADHHVVPFEPACR